MIKRWLMIGMIVAMACASSSAAAQPERAAVLAGGNYVLTTASDAVTQSPGYRLSPAPTAVDPALGCCCKTNLPCVTR
jgi:hypothetical protein